MLVGFDDGTVAQIAAADTVLGGIRNQLVAYGARAMVICNINPNNVVQAYAPDGAVFGDELSGGEAREPRPAGRARSRTRTGRRDIRRRSRTSWRRWRSAVSPSPRRAGSGRDRGDLWRLSLRRRGTPRGPAPLAPRGRGTSLEVVDGMKAKRHGSAHIARALHEMARLTLLARETPFRARAYARGASVVERLDDAALATLVAEGRSPSCAGVGPGLAAHHHRAACHGRQPGAERASRASARGRRRAQPRVGPRPRQDRRAQPSARGHHRCRAARGL
jgi:hypothetical protein